MPAVIRSRADDSSPAIRQGMVCRCSASPSQPCCLAQWRYCSMILMRLAVSCGKWNCKGSRRRAASAIEGCWDVHAFRDAFVEEQSGLHLVSLALGRRYRGSFVRCFPSRSERAA